MKDFSIHLRQAEMADCENIFKWRNSNVVRENSIQSLEISFDEHENWFLRTLARQDVFFLIAELNKNDALGTLRFDVRDSTAEISIYLTPSYIGKGYGLPLLESGIEWLKQNHPKIKCIEAKILPHNERSKKVFHHAGFNEYITVFRKELTHE